MVTAYTHKEHFELLKAWNDARCQYGLEQWMLPDLGFVSDIGAMAFLVTTNSPVAWMDNCAVNPTLNRTERDVAVAELIACLEQVSKDKGYRLVQAIAKADLGLAALLSNSGYTTSPGVFKYFVKQLESK